VQRPRVAFQGEPGAFSEDAALRLLGPEIELVPRPTFTDLFNSIDEGRANFVLAPIENSLIGPISAVADLLKVYSLVNAGEIVMQIRQQLIGCPGAVMEEIEAVESHPAALSQCRNFFKTHPRIEPVEADDTAGSVARIIRRGERGRAAIASRRAAEIYGGTIIQENLEDDEENYTRFILLTRGRGPDNQD
jgi:prephenate dehydratase